MAVASLIGGEIGANIGGNRLVSNLNKVQQTIENLDSYTSKKSDTEFWLKYNPSDGGWDFDVRIFLLENSLLVEVSSTTPAYIRDVKNLLTSLNKQTNVEFVDEDGEKVEEFFAQIAD